MAQWSEQTSRPDLADKSIEELTALARSLLDAVQTSSLSDQLPYRQASAILGQLLSSFDQSLLKDNAENIQVWKNVLISTTQLAQTLLEQDAK